MKSAISTLLAAILCAWSFAAAADDALEEILRTAALTNGFVPTAQLFDDTDEHLAPMGRQFFESENLSLNGGTSCRTCHLDRFGSADGLPVAVGIFGTGEGRERALSAGRIIPRNTLPLWGRGGKGFDTFFWDGKVDFSDGKRISQFGDHAPADDPLLVAVHLPPVEIREMLSDDATVSPFKRETPETATTLYDRIMAKLTETEPQALTELAPLLEKEREALAFRDIARTLAAFIRSEFRLQDTRFHRFVFGSERLSEDERAGGLLFYGKGKCAACHTGPYLSDFKFHAVPFPQLGFGKNGFGIDYGRFNVTFAPEDLYRFRTPPLFNVSRTAPYGHSGALADLRSAVRAHFDPLSMINTMNMDPMARHELFKRMAASGDELHLFSVLDDEEVDQVVSFLGTLGFE